MFFNRMNKRLCKQCWKSNANCEYCVANSHFEAKETKNLRALLTEMRDLVKDHPDFQKPEHDLLGIEVNRALSLNQGDDNV